MRKSSAAQESILLFLLLALGRPDTSRTVIETFKFSRVSSEHSAHSNTAELDRHKKV